VIGTWVALLMVLAGALPGLGLAAFRWRRIRARKAAGLELIWFQPTYVAGCPHMSISAAGLKGVSCLHCGPLPLQAQLPGVAA